MATLVLLIQMAFLSLAIAEQPFGNNLDRWWFLGTPVRNAPLLSSTPWLLQSQPAVVNRDDYTHTPGVGAHKCHSQARTWHEARRICEDEGGHLAIMNSIAEANATVSLIKQSKCLGSAYNWAFIGFHGLFEDGEYVTVHSQSLAKAGFTMWEKDEPTGGSKECGTLRDNGAGLADDSCSTKRPFVCELPIN